MSTGTPTMRYGSTRPARSPHLPSRSPPLSWKNAGSPWTTAYSEPIAAEVLTGVDVVVVAVGEAVPGLPGPRHEVWDPPHPPGTDPDGLRAVRDEIDLRVQDLLSQLTTHP